MKNKLDRLKKFLGVLCAIASIIILFQSAIPGVYATVVAPEGSTIPQTTVAFVPNILGGGLDFHEAAGGHTLERHVGKTEAQLAQRLASETRISAASSFTDRSVAEAAETGLCDPRVTVSLMVATRGYGSMSKGNR